MLPDFSAAVLAELDKIQAPASVHGESVGDPSGIRDLTGVPWASIDNDDSRDLDQLTAAEALPGGRVKIRVAVADVDALVKDSSAIDGHARFNTTSVYTAAKIFPMLPEKLSNGLTSLNLDEERLAVVVDMAIGPDGSLQGSDIYRARVRNQAKLAYNSVGAWLEGHGAVPGAIMAVNGLAENLRVQDRVAQSLKELRQAQGALSLETLEAKAVFDGDQIRDLEVERKNRAKELIEDFMIAANGVTARYLATKNFPSIRRVVRTPKRW
ncbi:MAG: ribonuclease catalytic domain-containing protein, partial [Candidatus Aminicenantales bacterium]